MERLAFTMQIHSGMEQEYLARHDAIWPDLKALLQTSGVRSYSIFLHPVTCQLFAYAEVESEERWEAIAQSEVCQRWWLHMRDIMTVHPDNSPTSLPLVEMFHL